ncbi:MAG TPA: hypothetical protein PLX90_12170, partial [Anaerolineales bacterium]|nr:hypothetical protein [Anaerolineales bacterium]
FGFNIEADDDAKIEMLGSFLSSWAEIDKTITKLVNKNKDQLHKLPSPAWLGKTGLPAWIIQNPVYGKTILTQLDVIDDNIANTIESLRAIRNSVIHGQKDFKDILSKETIKKTKQLETELKNLL